jgi:hypothetical protein
MKVEAHKIAQHNRDENTGQKRGCVFADEERGRGRCTHRMR